MTNIAYLGPSGTNTETVALAYSKHLQQTQNQESSLYPYPNIAQTLHAIDQKQADLAVVPVENSIQGSVAITLDTVWELERLQIQKALILPISHSLISYAQSYDQIKTVYSHPQALAQCQRWLDRNLPQANLVASNSTTEALQHLSSEPESSAIASPRAAQLYNLPVLATEIQDYPENSTRFWVLGLTPATTGSHISLAFTVPKNLPGALVKPLSIFADRNINLSRIESRPTKRYLGEYLFFIDLEASLEQESVTSALAELKQYTEILKIFGNYNILPVLIND